MNSKKEIYETKLSPLIADLMDICEKSGISLNLELFVDGNPPFYHLRKVWNEEHEIIWMEDDEDFGFISWESLGIDGKTKEAMIDFYGVKT